MNDRETRLERCFSPSKHEYVSAEKFCATLNVNVTNSALSDKDFRKFVADSLKIVEFPRLKPC